MSEDKIYKSNALIESNSKLSLAEQRLLYLACTQIEAVIKKDMTDKEYEDCIKKYEFEMIYIPIKDYIDTYHINDGNVYEEMKNICDKFWERTLYLREGGRLIKKRWVVTSEYNPNNYTIGIQFHPDLIADLLVLRNKYTILKFSALYGFTCKYTFKFYELMAQYKKISRRYIPLDDLRFYLGVEDGEYKMYSAFKRYILEKAINEINTKTDLYVECIENKMSRKIVGINFTIRNNTAVQETMNIGDITVPEIIITKEMITEIKDIFKEVLPLKDYKILLKEANGDTEVIRYLYEIMEVQNKEIKDITAWMRSAIKNKENYSKPVSRKSKKDNDSKFNNFEHREYNYESLERQLLGWDDKNGESIEAE